MKMIADWAKARERARNAGSERANWIVRGFSPGPAEGIAQALAALLAVYRLLRLLYYVQGLKVAEIARMPGADEGDCAATAAKLG